MPKNLTSRHAKLKLMSGAVPQKEKMEEQEREKDEQVNRMTQASPFQFT